jgi:hypothetical protein
LVGKEKPLKYFQDEPCTSSAAVHTWSIPEGANASKKVHDKNKTTSSRGHSTGASYSERVPRQATVNIQGLANLEVDIFLTYFEVNNKK